MSESDIPETRPRKGNEGNISQVNSSVESDGNHMRYLLNDELDEENVDKVEFNDVVDDGKIHNGVSSGVLSSKEFLDVDNENKEMTDEEDNEERLERLINDSKSEQREMM